MNKYFYTLAILLLSVSVHAQTFTEQQDSLFQHLDKNKIPSGVLYNRVFPWAGLDLEKDNDFNITYDYVKQAWLELELATYNPEGLLSIDELEQRVQVNHFENKGISIGYIDYYFNSIDTNAINNGDLIIGEDSLFYDGPSNPYLEHRVTMPVISSQSLSGSTVKFFFDPEIKLDNTGQPIDFITIHIVATGEQFNIHPGQTQEFNIDDIQDSIIHGVISFTKNGIVLPIDHDVIWHNSNWIVMTNLFNSDMCIEDGGLYSGEKLTFKGYDGGAMLEGYGNYRIFFRQIGENWDNCADDIQKPIIILDGFDPEDKRKIISQKDEPNIWDLLIYDNKTKHLGDELRKKGFDVIILNFPVYPVGNNEFIDGGADYIERNAMVLIRLIQVVNEKLKISGSSEQIVVVGPSMGGQIARYALAYMEKQYSLLHKDEMNHNTRLYISFDSPHLGANIPLSLQNAIYKIGYLNNNYNAQEKYRTQLRSIAARQMLIEQHRDGQAGTALYHKRYYNDLANNGVAGSNGWPINLRKVALINGSRKGVKIGKEGTEILNVSAGGVFKVLDIKASSMPAYLDMVSPFYYVKVKLNKASKGIVMNLNSRGSMDVVPGGTFNTAEVLYNESKKAAEEESKRLGIKVTFFKHVLEKNHSFIPSVSALAFKNNNFNWSTSFSHRYLVCEDAIPFDNYYAPSKNEDHVSLTPASAKWIMEEIEKGEKDCPPICKKNAMVANDYTPLCVGNFRSFYHNYILPPNATITWSIADNPNDISIVSSNSERVLVKGLIDNPKVTVRYRINNPCGADIHGSFTFAVGLIQGHINLYAYNSTYNEAKIINYNYPQYNYQWAWENTNYWGNDNSEKYPYKIQVIEKYDSKQPLLCLKTFNTCTTYVECIYPYLPAAPIMLNAQTEFEDKVIVYPNPGKDIWNVIFTNVGAVNDLKLYNAIGALVWEGKTDEIATEINISHLSPGMYILKVKNKQWNQTIKLVKE